MVHPYGQNAKDHWIRTLAETSRGRDAIGCHHRHHGRPSLYQMHNQLTFIESNNASTCAGEFGPNKQTRVTVEEA